MTLLNCNNNVLYLYINIFLYTYIHTYLHTYIHIYIYMYMQIRYPKSWKKHFEAAKAHLVRTSATVGLVLGMPTWALEYHTLILVFLKGTIMKKKVYTFFSLVT